MELIENLCRQDWKWKDEVRASPSCNSINTPTPISRGRDLEHRPTAQQIGRSFLHSFPYPAGMEGFESPKISMALLQQAFNTLARFDDRAEADILGA